MKVSEYLEKVERLTAEKPGKPARPALAKAMLKNTSIWDNDACRGYALVAARLIGLDEGQIDQLMCAMLAAFGDYSQDLAAELFRES